MAFRLADTFTDSLAKLTGDEQKAVKTTAFDLQLNPANPGMQFHTERHLLHVARARDHLLVTAVIRRRSLWTICGCESSARARSHEDA